MADHKHEYVGFNENGVNVQRCKSCLALQKGQDTDATGGIVQPEPVAQEGSGYVALDSNEETEAPAEEKK